MVGNNIVRQNSGFLFFCLSDIEPHIGAEKDSIAPLTVDKKLIRKIPVPISLIFNCIIIPKLKVTPILNRAVTSNGKRLYTEITNI